MHVLVQADTLILHQQLELDQEFGVKIIHVN